MLWWFFLLEFNGIYKLVTGGSSTPKPPGMAVCFSNMVIAGGNSVPPPVGSFLCVQWHPFLHHQITISFLLPSWGWDQVFLPHPPCLPFWPQWLSSPSLFYLFHLHSALKNSLLLPHTPFASDKDFLDLSHISILSLSPPPRAPAVQTPAASGISYLISAPVRLHTWKAPSPTFY